MGRLEEDDVARRDVGAEALLQRREVLVGEMAQALRARLADADHEVDAKLHRVVEDAPVHGERVLAKLEHVAEHRDPPRGARRRGERGEGRTIRRQ